MSLLDFFRPKKPAPTPGSSEEALLDALLGSVRGVVWPVPKIESWPRGREILDQEPALQARIAVAASRRLSRRRPARGTRWNEDPGHVLWELLHRLYRAQLPFDESQLIALIDDLGTSKAGSWDLPVGPVVAAIGRHVDAHGLGEPLRAALERLYRARGRDGSVSKDVRLRMQRLLRRDDETLAPDRWGRQAAAELARMPAQVRERWHALIAHAAEAAGKVRPSARWSRQAAERVAAIGAGDVCRVLGGWLDGLVPGPSAEGESVLGEANEEILRGLLLAAAPAGDLAFAARVGKLAEACYRKVPGYGPRAPRLGNGCLVALGRIAEHRGIAELSRLEGKVRYASARRMIASSLDEAADAAGLGRQELEEIGVPTYGLDAGGRCRRAVGDGEAEIAVEGDEVSLRWHRNGKITKGAPKAIREADPETVRDVRRTVKELGATLAGQAGRIERFYLEDRVLAAPVWRRRYLDHPLVATVARRLVWTLERDGACHTVLWRDGALRDLDGEDRASRLDETAEIALWHPVRASLEEVRTVRRLLAEARITQPFKQAHREIYLLTDAERETATYSNRFAAHIVRQHQFHALCQQRGWRYQLQGDFDSFNVPSRLLPAGDLVVELWVEPVEAPVTEIGIFQYLTTDQVRFSRREQRLELHEVPALAFSEAMRDVDLFTSVASVGNDPRWHDSGDHPPEWNEYWTSFAFGELNATAKTRREVLSELVPRLAIADRCHLDDRWLVVRGDLRTYRIHLRSGHVTMEPNAQYLCIVADRSMGAKTPRVRLPFAGDGMLSLILSKAFLLARDRDIEDTSIRRQIDA